VPDCTEELIFGAVLLPLRALNQQEDLMCDHGGLDWEDIALAGSLVEEIFEAEREKERIRKELSENEDDVDEDKED
jgi:hypothetical protein